MPCRDTSGPEPLRLLPLYQRLHREAEVSPAIRFSGIRKSLVNGLLHLAKRLHQTPAYITIAHHRSRENDQPADVAAPAVNSGHAVGCSNVDADSSCSA